MKMQRGHSQRRTKHTLVEKFGDFSTENGGHVSTTVTMEPLLVVSRICTIKR